MDVEIAGPLPDQVTIPIGDMKGGDWGFIVGGAYSGNRVYRHTNSSDVIDLDSNGESRRLHHGPRVRLLEPGEKITIERIA